MKQIKVIRETDPAIFEESVNAFLEELDEKGGDEPQLHFTEDANGWTAMIVYDHYIYETADEDPNT